MRVESTFFVEESELRKPITIVAYGDMRFTDPATLPPENVTARRALVGRIAQEKPDAVLLNGDLTMHGGDLGDYATYHTETKRASRASHARFVVIAGHIHNYERFERDGVVYLVSGGGGAPQQTIDREPDDLFRANSYPNFHYLKFTLSGATLDATMYRLANTNSAVWEAKDTFRVRARTGQSHKSLN
jgi:hypothetical protein